MTAFKNAVKSASGPVAFVVAVMGLWLATDANVFTRLAVWVASIFLLLVVMNLAKPYVAVLVTRIGRYEAVLAAAGVAQDRVNVLETEIAETSDIEKTARDEGIRCAFGAVLATASGAELGIKGSSTVTGELTIIATVLGGEVPAPGARFLASMSQLGTRRGVLQVTDHNADGTVHLVVVERLQGSDRFWDETERIADVEQSPPSLHLKPEPIFERFNEEMENYQ